MNAQTVARLYGRLAAAHQEPTTELVYETPFQLLIAVILSAQATDVSVNLATKELFSQHGTPQAMLALGPAKLLGYIRSIGLAPTKAGNIISTCALLLEKHQGQVPHHRQALEALPGVGRKTANVVLNVAFGEHTIAVDTHVYRVANRTGMAPGKNVKQVEEALLRITPKKFARHAHHHLILHGRHVCKARQPRCEACIIRKECEFPQKHLQP